MGCGVVWVDNNDSIMAQHSFSCNIGANAFTAELWAFLFVCLAVPSNSSIQIYTDCSSIISNFIGSDYERLLIRWDKLDLFAITPKLIAYIKANHISLEFIKVKAHSNNLFNDTADDCAKRAIYAGQFHISYKDII